MIFGTIARLIAAHKQKKMADALHPVQVNYADNAEGQERLGMARMSLNGRMAGANAFGNNIAQAQANTAGVARRNATSGSQAIAAAAASQMQANDAYGGLQMRENMDYSRKQGVLDNTLNQEGGKKFNDQLRQYLEVRRAKDALMNASLQNKVGAADSIDDGIGQVAGMFLGGVGGGGGSKSSQGAATPYLDPRIKPYWR